MIRVEATYRPDRGNPRLEKLPMVERVELELLRARRATLEGVPVHDAGEIAVRVISLDPDDTADDLRAWLRDVGKRHGWLTTTRVLS